MPDDPVPDGSEVPAPDDSASPKPDDSASPKPDDSVGSTPEAATPNVPTPQQPDSAFSPIAVPDTGYTPAGVPTLDGVREKIESRIGTALGATELAEETPEGRTAAQQFEARQKAAEEKLAEIRASMRKPDQD